MVLYAVYKYFYKDNINKATTDPRQRTLPKSWGKPHFKTVWL